MSLHPVHEEGVLNLIECPMGVTATKIYTTPLFQVVSEGLFQIQMRISFPLLIAKDLHRFLLIIRTHCFFTILYVGSTYKRLIYTWYKNISHMIAVLIVFLVENKRKGIR